MASKAARRRAIKRAAVIVQSGGPFLRRKGPQRSTVVDPVAAELARVPRSRSPFDAVELGYDRP